MTHMIYTNNKFMRTNSIFQTKPCLVKRVALLPIFANLFLKKKEREHK